MDDSFQIAPPSPPFLQNDNNDNDNNDSVPKLESFDFPFPFQEKMENRPPTPVTMPSTPILTQESSDLPCDIWKYLFEWIGGPDIALLKGLARISRNANISLCKDESVWFFFL